MYFLAFLLISVALVTQVSSFGYIFNRFRPEGRWRYGDVENDEIPLSPQQQLLQSLLGRQLMDDETCTGNACNANNQCCPGHICIGFRMDSMGTCVETQEQRKLFECESDLHCDEGEECIRGSCTYTGPKKGMNENCKDSNECDNGICCQLIRRHRQRPRKVCYVYKTPDECIGSVNNGEK